MKRLTGLDASFLSLETASSHMHVASLGIYDPSGVEGGFTLDRLAQTYSGRLPRFASGSSTSPSGCIIRCGSKIRTSTSATTCVTQPSRRPADPRSWPTSWDASSPCRSIAHDRSGRYG